MLFVWEDGLDRCDGGLDKDVMAIIAVRSRRLSYIDIVFGSCLVKFNNTVPSSWYGSLGSAVLGSGCNNYFVVRAIFHLLLLNLGRQILQMLMQTIVLHRGALQNKR